MMTFAFKPKKNIAKCLAAAAIGAGALALSAPAEARFGGFGGFHGGFGGFHRPVAFINHGFMHPGMFRPGFVNRPFFANRSVFSRSAFLNRRSFVSRRFFAYRPFFFRHRRFAGPFALGLVSGAAFESLAYDAPYYSYPAPYGEGCVIVRRPMVNPWGRIVVRRRLVCN